jgi:hypothetical protein
MISALRLVLFDDGNPLARSVALSPAVTWVVVGGGAYGALRGLIDAARLLRRRHQ